MPLHMEPLEVSVDPRTVASVLIVSCPVCPPVSLAIRRSSPLIELLQTGLRTGAFEAYVDELREPLERIGVRTDVYTRYTPFPTMCLWTNGQRLKLRRRAAEHDLVLVLGCASATRTVEEALEGTECRVVQAMRADGLTNAKLRYRFPATLLLEQAGRVAEDEAATREDHGARDEPSDPGARSDGARG